MLKNIKRLSVQVFKVLCYTGSLKPRLLEHNAPMLVIGTERFGLFSAVFGLASV